MVPRRVGLAALILALFTSPAFAAGDAREGKILTARWCVSCHATAGAAKGTDSAPSFVRIANDPARSPARLRSWLTSPHPPMPNLALSRADIDNILAWLDTLKSR